LNLIKKDRECGMDFYSPLRYPGVVEGDSPQNGDRAYSFLSFIL